MRLALASAALLLAACAPTRQAGPGPDRPAAPAPNGGSSASRAVDPEYARLSTPEKLDRTLASPSTRAVLEGRAGSPTSRVVPEQGSSYGRQVQDVPFAVRAVHGRRSSPYAAGSSITLRLPGPPAQPPPAPPGQPQLVVKETDGPQPPTVQAGRDYFVLARDVGIWAGGTTATVIVLTSPVDVFLVEPDGLVRGQGPWADFAEPLDTFRRRLAR